MASNPNRGRRAFSDVQAAQIRQLYAQGESQAAIARMFRVNSQTIGRLLRGDTYITTAAHDVRATVAEGYRQPDLNAPNASIDLVKRILAAPAVDIAAMGAVVPTTNTIPWQKARAYYAIAHEWPEGYTPTAEDLAHVGLDIPPSGV